MFLTFHLLHSMICTGNAYAPGVYTRVSSYREWIAQYVPEVNDLEYYNRLYEQFGDAPSADNSNSQHEDANAAAAPTRPPTFRPTRHPTPEPTKAQPTSQPTQRPTRQPTRRPTRRPTLRPTNMPTFRPTKLPTPHPTASPTKLSSCLNACGSASPDGSCYCEPSCVAAGDCCSDYQNVCDLQATSGNNGPQNGNTNAQSCKGSCGQFNGHCWCDALCKYTNDCCADIFEECGFSGTSDKPDKDAQSFLSIESSDSAQPSPAPTLAPTKNAGGSSCKGMCGSASPDGVCFCDDECHLNQDCCHDIELECQKAGNQDQTTKLKSPEDFQTSASSQTTIPTYTNIQKDTDAAAESCKNRCGDESASGLCFCDSECHVNTHSTQIRPKHFLFSIFICLFFCFFEISKP